METLNIDELLDIINDKIIQIHPEFNALKINDKTIRIYLDKKSILTLDFVPSEKDDYLVVSTDYMGLKDVIDFDPNDNESLLPKITNSLMSLNLTEKEIIVIWNSNN